MTENQRVIDKLLIEGTLRRISHNMPLNLYLIQSKANLSMFSNKANDGMIKLATKIFGNILKMAIAKGKNTQFQLTLLIIIGILQIGHLDYYTLEFRMDGTKINGGNEASC